MAPITRRKSASARPKKDNTEAKIKKAPKTRLSPLKSAIRDKLHGTVKVRRVKFQHEDDDTTVHVHLPTTPHPMAENALSAFPSPQAPTCQSKREEQEELLKRAARILEKRAKSTTGFQTPPLSPEGRRSSPFEDPAKATEKKQTEKAARNKILTSIEETSASNEDEFVRPTSEAIDLVKDEIPNVVGMPASIRKILVNPTTDIKMEEICTAFDSLKAQIQTHCREYYSYSMTPETRAIPSFVYLKAKHPELFRYIQYVADGSQYGWDKLIDIGSQRENLVYAIISRALISHVFDAELFGAAVEDEEKLLQMCREYLNFDAFVRNTHRAETVLSILRENGRKDSSPDSFTAAVHSLRQRIDVMLRPLGQKPQIRSTEYAKSLNSIIATALKVHLAIRLVGASGTVYRFEHIHKLAHWDGTTMNCVNQRRTDLTPHHGDEPLVKICCFPMVEATVPSGPNLENFADPAYVEEWKNTADPDAEKDSKPIITIYPITLADVVLENTPMTDRSNFTTLAQTMFLEQTTMSDGEFLSLTGIDRARRRRFKKIVKGAKKTVSHAARTGAGLAAAAATWYLYQNAPDLTSSPTIATIKNLLKRASRRVLGSTILTVRTATTKLVKSTRSASIPMSSSTRARTTMTLTRETDFALDWGAYATAR
jgi:hypothetical protein